MRRQPSAPALPRPAAGGSLLLAASRRRLLLRSRLRLAAELAVIGLGLPFGFGYAVYHLDVPFTPMMFALLAICLLCLANDQSFSFPREFARGIKPRELFSITVLFVAVGSLIAAWVLVDDPRQFLSLPTGRPDAWLSLMLLYPLLSALPQEIAYRTFFFHRYAPLFAGRPWLAVAANGVMFGFAHVIYGSLVSVGLSAGLGLVLAWRYWRTRSLWLVWLEHALWGNFVFTIGLGHYFMNVGH